MEFIIFISGDFSGVSNNGRKIIAIIIFSTIIISLMYNNALQNKKIKKEALAIIYITETFENVGIASFDDITSDNISNFVPIEVGRYYTVSTDVTELDQNEYEKIIKKVSISLSYKVGNKTYDVTMERLKAKE